MVDGGGQFQLRGVLLERRNRPAHQGVRAFIHPDPGAFEPAFGAQMSGEILEETPPKRIVSVGPGLQFEIDLTRRRRIVITEFQRPRDHGVAMDSSGFHADFIGHKADPLVEDRVVVSPRSICMAGPSNHGRKGVVGLAAPSFFDQGAGDGFLARFGEPLHLGFQQGKVLGRPGGHVVPAGDRLRLLPQVEVEFPCAGCWQRGSENIQRNRKCERSLIAARGENTSVAPCRRICGNIEGEPDRTVGPGGERQARCGVEDVALRFAIGERVADEIRLHGDLPAAVGHGRGFESQVAVIGRGGHHHLRIDALAAPTGEWNAGAGGAEREWTGRWIAGVEAADAAGEFGGRKLGVCFDFDQMAACFLASRVFEKGGAQVANRAGGEGKRIALGRGGDRVGGLVT